MESPAILCHNAIVKSPKAATSKFRFFGTILICSLFVTHLQPANGIERKRATWLAACPEVIDETPQLQTPKTIFLRSPSGQQFKLLSSNSLDFVTEPQSIIGCYVVEELVTNSNSSPAWQIGALNRDGRGFYFKNQAGITWRLSLNSETLILETEPGSPYYAKGSGFRLDSDAVKANDCKVRDYYLSPIRLGFPRNLARVPSLGETKNLILVVDFPDAILDQTADLAVENIIAPRIVEDFYYLSSNEKFKPTFTIFPKVIRLNSLEKSFAPNPTGGFFVGGVQQDHRLVFEAVKIARTLGNLEGYSSINILAPTANSMGYYGSAFTDVPVDLGNTKIYNTQLIGGTIGTIRSYPPSWKVFAHEYGHLLGMYDYYDSRTGSKSFPGPFDIMGNHGGDSNSFFGFQRWVQGWIEDKDVICDFTTNSSVSHSLTPLNQNSGKRLYVHPIDGSKVLVIEFRTESQFDLLKGNDGLLVYLIDMKVGQGSGPISIQHSEEDIVSNPRNFFEKFARAPLSSGQTVKVTNLVVLAEEVSREKATFKVLTSVEYQAKQEAEAKAKAKAAAELKAKEEAEAKAAAELKAKQEAEAKAAAELKTKQEAEAKAAAEQKAKQEAEAKAAADKAASDALGKKTTITCIKGKVTKKVTAIKPKCPTGYKKK